MNIIPKHEIDELVTKVKSMSHLSRGKYCFETCKDGTSDLDIYDIVEYKDKLYQITKLRVGWFYANRVTRV